MNVDKQDQAMRHKALWGRGRRAMGMAAIGAVVASGLGIVPAVAALPAGGAGLSPAALAGVLPAAVMPTKSEGGVGPLDPRNGYPYWYADKGDPAQGLDPVRLELCIDAADCPVIGVDYDPAAPLTIPENFPEESFWWSGETTLTLPDGAEARLIMAQEAAFSGVGEVAAGAQNGFARLRIRLEDGQANQQYTFTHPYGVDVLTADDRGRIRFTEDVGCMQQPCGWDETSNGRIGPSFLRWDPAVAPAAPEGFIGDPNVEHRVVGSPNNTNYFAVSGPGNGPELGRTDLFAVQGKIATMKAGVDKPGGLYKEALTVNIQASLPDVAKIVYTTDGSEPEVDADGNIVNGTEGVPETPGLEAAVAVEFGTPGTNTLKYLAFDTQTKRSSEVYTETYDLNADRPWLTASPDPAPGALAGPQTVTLTGVTNDPAVPAEVYYTTDGTTPALTEAGEPAGTTREYTEPMLVGMSTTIRAIAVDPATGIESEIGSFPFKINNLSAVGPNGDHGFPLWLRDNGWEGQEPVQLDLCLDDPLCPVVDVLPDPTQATSWPDNFPGEAFWFAADAEFDAGGEAVELTLGSEAAFGADMVQDGAQVAFGRVRIRGDQAFEVGATYRFTHPYGTVDITADAEGTINYTEDLGALNATGDFSSLLEARIGPFLRWTEGAPEGYLGDGNTPHAVVGSPYGTNVFKVEQVTEGDGDPIEPELFGETDQFVVQGRISGATPPEAPSVVSDGRDGGLFATDQLVALTASPDTAQIFFTTDGTEPTTESTLYTEPIAITAEGTTTLRFLAVNGGVPSEIVTQTFTLDKTAPAVEASPAGGEVAAGDLVTLTASEGASIFYTLDGSEPTAQSLAYTEPLQFPASATLRAIAVDAAGNTSDLGTWEFTAASGETPGEENPVEENPGETPGEPGEQTPGETPDEENPGETPAEPTPGETAGETPVDEPRPADAKRDFSGDSSADLLATGRDGRLWLYSGSGSGGFSAQEQIGVRWNGMTRILSSGDLDGDGLPDVIARENSGKLWIYPGSGAGRLLPRKQLGHGWNGMTDILAPGDFNGDGNNDLMARNQAGDLWLYPGRNGGGFAAAQRIGSRWNGMTMIIAAGDTTGDGNPDIVARDAAGGLWLYPGNGAGRFAARTQVGARWNGMTLIMGSGDFNGDSRNDLIARDVSGGLWLYAGKGDGRYASQQKIGRGWNGMTNIF